MRAYERERDEFRADIIALKKRRRVALGDLMTIVFENTDTMRFQIQEMARAERMLTDEQIEHEVETYNELIPERRRAVGHAVHRAHRRGRAPRVAAEARRHRATTCRFELGVRTTGRGCRPSRGRGAAHPRGHHHDRPLPASSRSRRSSRRDVRHRPGPHRRRPPRVPGVGRAHRRRSAPSSPATSPPDVVEIQVQRLDPELPLPGASSTPTTPATTSTPRAASSSQPAGGRALVPTGIAVAIPPGYAGLRAAALGPRAEARRHLPEHARPHRLRSTAASSRCCS